MSQGNVGAVLRLIAAVNRHELEAALQELSKDAAYMDHRASGREEFQGREAFRAHFSAIWRAAPNVHIVAETVSHRGDKVVMRQVVGWTDSDGVPAQEVRWVTRTLCDGLISRVDVFDCRSRALEAARVQG